jgi:hypothetical protein
MDKKIKLSVMSIFVAAALLGSIVAVSSTIDNQAFAGGDNHDKKKKKSNEAAQVLSQDTETVQLSECGSGNDTVASCNNLAFSVNLNDGNNALGQQ